MINRSLFWKEWRENGLLVLLPSALFASVLAAMTAYAANRLPGHRADFLATNDVRDLIYACWAVTSLILGSFLSPESQSGTLQFLASLPIRRSVALRTKLACGLSIFVLSIISASAVSLVLCSVAAGFHMIASDAVAMLLRDILSSQVVLLATVAAMLLSALVSILTDNKIPAIVVSAMIALAATVAVGNASDWAAKLFGLSHESCTLWQIALCIFALVYACYQVFVYGESLRTSKRFLILVRVVLLDLGPVPAALAIAAAVLFPTAGSN